MLSCIVICTVKCFNVYKGIASNTAFIHNNILLKCIIESFFYYIAMSVIGLLLAICPYQKYKHSYFTSVHSTDYIYIQSCERKREKNSDPISTYMLCTSILICILIFALFIEWIKRSRLWRVLRSKLHSRIFVTFCVNDYRVVYQLNSFY